MTREHREVKTIQRDSADLPAHAEIHEQHAVRELSPEELAEQEMSEVPERKSTSLNNASVPSDNSTGHAGATQPTPSPRET